MKCLKNVNFLHSYKLWMWFVKQNRILKAGFHHSNYDMYCLSLKKAVKDKVIMLSSSSCTICTWKVGPCKNTTIFFFKLCTEETESWFKFAIYLIPDVYFNLTLRCVIYFKQVPCRENRKSIFFFFFLVSICKVLMLGKGCNM